VRGISMATHWLMSFSVCLLHLLEGGQRMLCTVPMGLLGGTCRLGILGCLLLVVKQEMKLAGLLRVLDM
jgi:hypothetical protein